MKNNNKHTPTSGHSSEQTRTVEFDDSTFDDIDFEVEDLCKGPFCESHGIDKI